MNTNELMVDDVAEIAPSTDSDLIALTVAELADVGGGTTYVLY